jgi:hypothetical protein
MINLVSTTDKLQVVTAQAVPIDVHVSWVDLAGTTVTPGRTNTAITTATTTDIVAAPPASTQRNVKTINIHNKHATDSCDVTVNYNVSGTLTQLYKATIRAGEVMQYVEGVGWQIVTVSSTVSMSPLRVWPSEAVSTQTSAMTAAHFSTVATRTTVTAAVFPMPVDYQVQADRIVMPIHVSITSATTTANWSFTLGHSFGLYSLNGASLSLVSSFSNYQAMSYTSAANSTNASASWVMSFGSGAELSSSTSLSTNNAGNTSLWTSISSVKLHPYAYGPFSVPSSQFFGVWAFSSSTGGANLASITGIGIHTNAAVVVQEIGTPVASTQGWMPLMGAVSATQTNTALPPAIATSNITTRSNNASWVMRLPAIQFSSRY